jgi:hypothetical protein
LLATVLRSPDGRRLAASNWNHSVRTWDTVERISPAAKPVLVAEAEAGARVP